MRILAAHAAWLLAIASVVASPQAPPPPFTRPAAEALFWCAMHPDQRSPRPGTCPVCGMPLTPIPPPRFETYPVDLRATPTTNGVRLRLAVRSPGGAIVRRFTIVHERPMHLFVVGNGLQFFTHVHPVQQRDGVFLLDVELPRRGPYMAIAEFLPEGGTPQMYQQVFSTGGAVDIPSSIAIDTEAKVVDGLRVAIDASALHSGRASRLAFRVEDPVSGTAVEDLEPYLGARAHLLIVPVDLTEAIHGHPDDGPGDRIVFAPILPRPGRYKLWLQIQRRGQVTTVPFVVSVP